jgi:plasmid stability protein
MNKHIQIRNVPPSLHRKLKMRAVAQDMTLTDYVKRLIAHDLAFPSLTEIADEARKLPAVKTSRSIADVVREDRDSH